MACAPKDIPLKLVAYEGVSLKIPVQWQLVETSNQGEDTQLVFSGPKQHALRVLLDAPPLRNLDQYFEQEIERITDTSFDIKDPSEVLSGHVRRQRLIGYYATLYSQPPMFMELLESVDSERQALLTFSAPLTEKSALKATIDPVINSLQIKRIKE